MLCDRFCVPHPSSEHPIRTMAEITVDQQNPFDEARQSILHMKCRFIKKYDQRMKSDFGKTRKVGRFRQVIENGHFGSIPTLFWIVLAFWTLDIIHSMIQFRCSQFGGSKCRFPFDVLPEWMMESDQVLH